MNKDDILNNINERKGFPRTYRFNQFIRWFTLILGLFACVYSLWLIFFKIESESSTFFKIVPFIIMFFAFNSILKNLFSLNTIIFKENKGIFKFIARKSVTIPWVNITKMNFQESRQRLIKVYYEQDGEKKIFNLTLAFPNMLEILNSIAELNPDIEYDKFMKNIIISETAKSKSKKAELDKSKIENENDKKN